MKTLTTAGSARLVSFRSTFGKILRSVSFGLFVTVLLLGVHALHATQLLPGVYGYGLDKGTVAIPGNTAGFGPNAIVIPVSDLSDYGAGETLIPNTLRAALADTRTQPRIIVFTKSGLITLKRNLNITRANCTIAGQTAPWPGVTIRGASLTVTANNVLVQHLRLRPGDAWNAVTTSNRDAVRVEGGTDAVPVKNVVFDHCTFSWTLDEAASTWNVWDDVTFNRCLFAEPLNLSIHVDEGQFPGNVPLQAELISTVTYGGGATGIPQEDSHAVRITPTGNNYHLVTGNSANDYVEYAFDIESSTSARLDNFPLITGLTGANQAQFKVEVYAGGGTMPVYTSQVFDPNHAADRVDFIGENSSPSHLPFTIPAVAKDANGHPVVATVPYRVRLVLLGQTGTNWQVGVDQIAFIQRHGMGPIFGWGGTNAGAKLTFTGSVIAHILARGPWIYPQQFVFANNVLYNRYYYFMHLGHAEEKDSHLIATVKAEIIGNRFIEGSSWNPSSGFSPIHNVGLSSSSQIHQTDNDWNHDGYTGTTTLLGGFTTPDARLVGSNPVSQTEGMAGFTAVSSAEAFNGALLNAGARPAERDSAERGVIHNLAQAIYTTNWALRPGAIVDSVTAAGGWPTEDFIENPSTWTLPADPNSDLDGNGYTRVEEWLQQLSAQVEGSTPDVEVYNEGFVGPATALNWTPFPAGTTWTANGTYSTAANLYPAFSVYNGGKWATNFSVSAKLKNSWTSANNRVGLVYNYVDASNYSYVSFNTAGLVEISRVTAGAAPQLIATGTYAGGGSGVTFEAMVRRRGNMTAVLVNGVPCLPNVWEPGLGSGNAGVFTRFTSTGVFDDFKVRMIPAAATAFYDFENSSTAGLTTTNGTTGGGAWAVLTEGANKVYQQS